QQQQRALRRRNFRRLRRLFAADQFGGFRQRRVLRGRRHRERGHARAARYDRVGQQRGIRRRRHRQSLCRHAHGRELDDLEQHNHQRQPGFYLLQRGRRPLQRRQRDARQHDDRRQQGRLRRRRNLQQRRPDAHQRDDREQQRLQRRRPLQRRV